MNELTGADFKSATAGDNKKLFIETYGCQMNVADSEVIASVMQMAGYSVAETLEEADAVFMNTCSIRDNAEQKILNRLEFFHSLKKKKKRLIVGVLGCMAERVKDDLITNHHVDLVVGPDAYLTLPDLIAAVETGEKAINVELSTTETYRDVIPSRICGNHISGFVSIMRGCNNFCTYCIIPKLRGPYRSVPMEELIAEAKTMAEQGVKELVLVAQETTIYGIDLYGKPSLHLLLKELCKIQELYWIRILYCYPEDIYPELVQTMKEELKVCHYLDLPIQHANDEILRRMGRRTSKQELIDKIDFLRSEMPDITLRTTLITGFPGETKEQHKELLEFINDMEFDRLGVFTYSPEEGTPAAAMEHQIDEEVKLDRQAELMELQQDISAELGERRIGQELLVMIEGKVADEDAYVGRSQADAPGVDGYVFVNTPETLVSGDFVRVKITGALEYDLIGGIEE